MQWVFVFIITNYVHDYVHFVSRLRFVLQGESENYILTVENKTESVANIIFFCKQTGKEINKGFVLHRGILYVKVLPNKHPYLYSSLNTFTAGLYVESEVGHHSLK